MQAEAYLVYNAHLNLATKVSFRGSFMSDFEQQIMYRTFKSFNTLAYTMIYFNSRHVTIKPYEKK